MNILVFRWNLASKVFRQNPCFMFLHLIVECHPRPGPCGFIFFCEWQELCRLLFIVDRALGTTAPPSITELVEESMGLCIGGCAWHHG